MTDSFRDLADINKPDSGWEALPVFDPQTGNCRPITVEDIHQRLCKLELNKNVPQQVRTHFDTTRNLLLYSWFVRAFIPVADWHACACLELAMKTKTGGKIRYLPNLIRYAIDQGWIKNEAFSRWRAGKDVFEDNLQWQRQLYEDLGIPFDPPNGGAFGWDYVSVLLEFLRSVRNEYAHGSTAFYGGAVSLNVVVEFINQLFPDDSDSKQSNDGV
jgi:hypothetical protein